MSEIKGIIYDLDGTIIETVKLHESAWLYAGRKFDVEISNEMLINQRGIPNDAAAEFMLPEHKKELIRDFVTAKIEYVMENVNQTTLFPGAAKVISRLCRNGYKVWICTSASKDFVLKIMNNLPDLKDVMKNHIVWREMYKEGKPSPEALNLTMEKMGLTNSQVCYVGDAFSDYQTSLNAKVKFIYFRPDLKERDLRIPDSIPMISSHKEIWRWL